ncbi:Hypothetical predicted protein, partial [Podarcis lilfordi]
LEAALWAGASRSAPLPKEFAGAAGFCPARVQSAAGVRRAPSLERARTGVPRDPWKATRSRRAAFQASLRCGGDRKAEVWGEAGGGQPGGSGLGSQANWERNQTQSTGQHF